MGQLSGLWLDDSRIYLVRPDTERGRVCVMEMEMFTVPNNKEQTRATNTGLGVHRTKICPKKNTLVTSALPAIGTTLQIAFALKVFIYPFWLYTTSLR